MEASNTHGKMKVKLVVDGVVKRIRLPEHLSMTLLEERLPAQVQGKCKLQYRDEEGEWVDLSEDQDLQEAVEMARDAGKDCLRVEAVTPGNPQALPNVPLADFATRLREEYAEMAGHPLGEKYEKKMEKVLRHADAKRWRLERHNPDKVERWEARMRPQVEARLRRVVDEALDALLSESAPSSAPECSDGEKPNAGTRKAPKEAKKKLKKNAKARATQTGDDEQVSGKDGEQAMAAPSVEDVESKASKLAERVLEHLDLLESFSSTLLRDLHQREVLQEAVRLPEVVGSVQEAMRRTTEGAPLHRVLEPLVRNNAFAHILEHFLQVPGVDTTLVANTLGVVLHESGLVEAGAVEAIAERKAGGRPSSGGPFIPILTPGFAQAVADRVSVHRMPGQVVGCLLLFLAFGTTQQTSASGGLEQARALGHLQRQAEEWEAVERHSPKKHAAPAAGGGGKDATKRNGKKEKQKQKEKQKEKEEKKKKKKQELKEKKEATKAKKRAKAVAVTSTSNSESTSESESETEAEPDVKKAKAKQKAAKLKGKHEKQAAKQKQKEKMKAHKDTQNRIKRRNKPDRDHSLSTEDGNDEKVLHGHSQYEDDDAPEESAAASEMRLSMQDMEAELKDQWSIVHHGVVCDGCEMAPIRGIRYKSATRENYDLCALCEAQQWQKTDDAFLKIRHPEQSPATILCILHPHQGQQQEQEQEKRSNSGRQRCRWLDRMARHRDRRHHRRQGSSHRRHGSHGRRHRRREEPDRANRCQSEKGTLFRTVQGWLANFKPWLQHREGGESPFFHRSQESSAPTAPPASKGPCVGSSNPEDEEERALRIAIKESLTSTAPQPPRHDSESPVFVHDEEDGGADSYAEDHHAATGADVAGEEDSTRPAKTHRATSPEAARVPNLRARFVSQITLADGDDTWATESVVKPRQPVLRAWRMANNGTVPWPPGCRLMHVSGAQLNGPVEGVSVNPNRSIEPGQKVDLAVRFVAPAEVGRYSSFWRLVTPENVRFGHRMWVDLTVSEDGTVPPPSFKKTSSGEQECAKGGLRPLEGADDEDVGAKSCVGEENNGEGQPSQEPKQPNEGSVGDGSADAVHEDFVMVSCDGDDGEEDRRQQEADEEENNQRGAGGEELNESEFEPALAMLAQMGFTDRQQLEPLLQQHEGDVTRVLACIFQEP